MFKIGICRIFEWHTLVFVIGALIVTGCFGGVVPSYAGDDPAVEDKEPGVISAVITDSGAVMDGKRRRDGLSVRPFLEEWTGFVAVQNTGTTFIDNFRVSFTCPMEGTDAIRINMVSPSMPSWLWKPFAGDMLSLCTRGMDFTIKEGRVEMRDVATGEAVSTRHYAAQPLGPEGLAPGETVLIDYTEPYANCLEGFVYSIAARKAMDIETEIVDRENNIMHMLIKKYKMAFLTFDQIVVEITFKGVGEYASCSLDLSIEGQLLDSVPWVEYEWK